MARPTSKTDLMQAAAANLQKLNDFVAGMTEAEMSTPFDFSADEKKKEAHWRRDKNLRDVLIHLWEWHQLLLKWVQANQAGGSGLFCPRPTTCLLYTSDAADGLTRVVLAERLVSQELSGAGL